jgi:hypothetical protein
LMQALQITLHPVQVLPQCMERCNSVHLAVISGRQR